MSGLAGGRLALAALARRCSIAPQIGHEYVSERTAFSSRLLLRIAPDALGHAKIAHGRLACRGSRHRPIIAHVFTVIHRHPLTCLYTIMLWCKDINGKETTMAREKRHPAEVTSDRLADASERWHDKFTGEELDMIGRIRHALEQIAEGER